MPSPSHRDTLLLIDDNPARAMSVRAALTTSDGPRVAWVPSLSEGLACLERTEIAALLLTLFPPDGRDADGRDPDGRGIDAFDKARAAAGTIPILVLCRKDDESLASLAVERGADDFLLDSHFDRYSLTRAVRRMLERAATAAPAPEPDRAAITLNSIGDAVMATDDAGRVTYLNAAAEFMTGWSRAEAAGRSHVEIFNVIDGTTGVRLADPMAAAIQDNRTVRLPANAVLLRRDGREIPIEDSVAPIHDRSGQSVGAVVVFHDVSEARRISARLSHLAQHDFLTDLPNRLLVRDRLQQAIALAQRHGYRVAVLFLDLDRFKEINDVLGHLVGDELLRAVAARLKGSIRRSDTVGRHGGDEFVVILSELEAPDSAGMHALKLRGTLSAPYQIGPHQLRVPASIGVSIYPDDGTDGDVLIGYADAAMYHAKSNGGPGRACFTRDMLAPAARQPFAD